MFRGNWGERFTPKLIGLVLAGLLAVSVGFGAILYGFSEQIENDWHSYQRKAEYTKDTYSPAYNSCLSLPANGQADCISKAAKEYRENERDQDDLAAQQTTAVWTFLMGCAAIVGVMLSILGVFLVYTTFSETRKANEIAKDNARKQIRPFVYVTKVAFDYTFGRQYHAVKFAFDVHIKNFGQTPAKNVTMKICSLVRVYDDFNFSKNLSGAEISKMNDVAPNFENWREDHLLTISYEDWQAVKAGTSCIYVDGVLEYHDAFGQEFTTEFRRLTFAKHILKKTMLDAHSGNKAT